MQSAEDREPETPPDESGADQSKRRSTSPVAQGASNVLDGAKALVPLQAQRAALTKATRGATTTTTKAVLFAAGFPLGTALSAPAAALLVLVYPWTVPITLFLTLSLSFAAGLAATRLPVYGVFGRRATRQIERAYDIYRLKVESIDQQIRALQERGDVDPDLLRALDRDRYEARTVYQRALDAANATAEIDDR